MKKKHQANVFSIALLAILLSLTLLFEFASGYFVLWTGFTTEIHIVFYIISICMFWKISYSICFIIIAPLLWLTTPGEYMIHPGQFFIEYILCSYIFSLILINYQFVLKSKNKLIYYFYFIFLIIIAYLIKLFLHILCGVLWWNADWLGSIILNSQTIGIGMAINIPLIIIAIIPCLKIKKSYLPYLVNKWN